MSIFDDGDVFFVAPEILLGLQHQTRGTSVQRQRVGLLAVGSSSRPATAPEPGYRCVAAGTTVVRAAHTASPTRLQTLQTTKQMGAASINIPRGCQKHTRADECSAPRALSFTSPQLDVLELAAMDRRVSFIAHTPPSSAKRPPGAVLDASSRTSREACGQLKGQLRGPNLYANMVGVAQVLEHKTPHTFSRRARLLGVPNGRNVRPRPVHDPRNAAMEAAALEEHAVAEKAALTFDQLHQTRTGRARRLLSSISTDVTSGVKSLTFDRLASEVFTTRIILPPTPPPPPPPRPPNMSPHPRPLTPTDTPPPLVLGPLPVARAVVGRCSPDRPPTPPAASRLDPTPTHASPIATAQPPLVTPRPKSPPPPTPSPPEMARSPQSRPSRPRMPQSPLPPSPKAFGDVNPRELKAQAARWSPSPGASLGPKAWAALPLRPVSSPRDEVLRLWSPIGSGTDTRYDGADVNQWVSSRSSSCTITSP